MMMMWKRTCKHPDFPKHERVEFKGDSGGDEECPDCKTTMRFLGRSQPDGRVRLVCPGCGYIILLSTVCKLKLCDTCTKVVKVGVGECRGCIKYNAREMMNTMEQTLMKEWFMRVSSIIVGTVIGFLCIMGLMILFGGAIVV